MFLYWLLECLDWLVTYSLSLFYTAVIEIGSFTFFLLCKYLFNFTMINTFIKHNPLSAVSYPIYAYIFIGVFSFRLSVCDCVLIVDSVMQKSMLPYFTKDSPDMPVWFNDTNPYIWYPLKGIVVTVNIYLMVSISAERFRAVCYPLSRRHVSSNRHWNNLVVHRKNEINFIPWIRRYKNVIKLLYSHWYFSHRSNTPLLLLSHP